MRRRLDKEAGARQRTLICAFAWALCLGISGGLLLLLLEIAHRWLLVRAALSPLLPAP